MHPSTKISLIALSILLIFVAPVFSAGTGISIVITNYSATFSDVGNATPQNHTFIANVTNSGSDTDGTIGQYNLNFTNVTFILPFGVNPRTPGECNATTYIWAAVNSTNGTLNSTHVACTIGSWNLTPGQSMNFTLNVTTNISALTMNHLARGASTVSALIYAIANATNNSTANFAGAISAPTSHNSSSFWINPKPYAYSTDNGTVYITSFNQTRSGYIVDVPIMTYNISLGMPVTASNTFGEIKYMNATFMDAPSMIDPFFMELFSYNMTFKVVIPFAANATTQTYLINSPAVAGNQTLMPLLTQLITVAGMMGENFTMSMALPSPQGFSVYYGTNSSSSGIYDTTNLTTLKGITISHNPSYNANSPMLNITTTNISALNNTDISILFTLMDFANSKTSSPIYVRAQQLAGFDMTAPPKFGDNITNTFIINLSNSLDNYTLSNLSVRFMLPINVSILNGSSSGTSSNITNMDNATFVQSSGKATYAYSAPWVGASNFSKTVDIVDRLGRGMDQGTTVRINFTFVDVNLNMPQFNNWIPGGQTANGSFVTLNLTTFMSFPIMNESSNTAAATTTKSYNATIQMPQQGRMNLTDKVPGWGSDNVTNYNVSLDGTALTKEDGNLTFGSLLLNNVGSGSHTISVSYVVSSSSTSSSTGGAAGGSSSGGGADAGTTATITPDAPVATIDKAVAGTTVSISIQVAVPSGGGGGTTKEAHKMEIVSITGTLIKLKFTSEPLYVDINVGQTKYIDINGDGVNDVKVTANSVSGGVASITVELLPSAKGQAASKPYVPSTPSVEQPAVTTGGEAPTALPTAVPAKPISPIIMIVIVAALLIVGVVYYLYSQKSK